VPEVSRISAPSGMSPISPARMR
jgi:hypothetical protein